MVFGAQESTWMKPLSDKLSPSDLSPLGDLSSPLHDLLPCRFGSLSLGLGLLLGAALLLKKSLLWSKFCPRSIRLALSPLAWSPPLSGKPRACTILACSTKLNFLSTKLPLSRRLSQRIRILSLQIRSLMPQLPPGSPRAIFCPFSTIRILPYLWCLNELVLNGLWTYCFIHLFSLVFGRTYPV